VTALGTALLLAALAPQGPPADPLRIAKGPDSALVLEARTRPLAVRESVSAALTKSVRGGGNQALLRARRFATAYAVAWRDSFLLREVTRFAGWPAERRAGKVWADSVRRAGIVVFGRDGAMAAVAVWRRALVVSDAVADTAGMATILGNIGAAFSVDGPADSAEAYLERARMLAAAIGHLVVEANAIGLLGDLREARGELADARALYLEALALRQRIGDTRGVAAAYNALGLLAQDLGDLDEARRQFEAALALNRRDGRNEVAATNLVNLAGLAAFTGDFGRAERLYRDALATWKAREQWADAADALRGLGLLELRRGDYPAARSALSEALEIYDRTGPLDNAVAVRAELASALGAAGELQGAIDELRHAERLADSGQAGSSVRAGLALAQADLAVELNTLDAAERLYAEAEALYAKAGDAAGQAEAQQGQGMMVLERGDHDKAELLLDAALRTETGSGNGRAAALTRLSLGRLATQRGDTAAGRQQLEEVVNELDRLGDPVGVAAALGAQAALEADRGFPAAAEALYRAGLARLRGVVAPETAWQLHAGLAQALRAQGAAEPAVQELRAAIAEVEHTSQSLALAERREGFLTDKWDVYVQLARAERAAGRPAAVFDASERLRAREMLDLLARGRIAAPSDTAAELVSREQDLRRRIAELTHGLEATAPKSDALRGPNVSLASGTTREALLRAQEEYGGLLLEIRERAPRHAALVAGETVSWQDVARRLAEHEAMVEYLVSDSGSLALVVTRDTLAVVDLGVGRRALARLVEFARGTLGPRGPGGADSLWRGALRRLDEYLVAPLEEAGLLAGTTRLVVVPHAELHYLPFAALLSGQRPGRFLVERYELSVTPSASVWVALGERRRRAGHGVLAFAPKPNALPASREEVGGIARIAGADARVLTGRAASEAALRRDGPNRRILHLATYGVLNKPNPLFSYVELAAGGGYDGRLEVHEVLGLDVAADLVVLSACQTGLGSGGLADVPAGDDWVGLTRAFLHAGAAHVVATLWPVEDQATGALMERFYAELKSGAGPALALARAQRALLAQRATAHPFYWAGFVAVGGPGGVGRRP